MAKYVEKQLELDKETYPNIAHKFIGLDFDTYLEYNGEDNKFQGIHNGRNPEIGKRYRVVGIGMGGNGIYQSVSIHHTTEVNGKLIDDMADIYLTPDSKLFKKVLILEPEDELYIKKLKEDITKAEEVVKETVTKLKPYMKDIETIESAQRKLDSLVYVIEQEKDRMRNKYINDQFKEKR